MRVIVVGAGLSGLVCATRLAAAGCTVHVREASDRVGGRLLTGSVGGELVDLGGQFLSVGQPRLLALASELAIASRPAVGEGAAVIDLQRSWWARLRMAFAQRRAMRRIHALCAAPPDAAAERSLADHLATIRNADARAMLGLHAELVFACLPEQLQLGCYLRRLAVTGYFAPEGPDLPGGGREHVFVGGAQQLATVLAARLGDRVQLAAPVHAIRDHGDSVRVDAEIADHVVLALPPRAAAAIAVDLPAAHRAYLADVVARPVRKTFVAYARPFWRDRGLSGQAYMFSSPYVRGVVPADGAVLLAYTIGDLAHAPNRDAVLEALVALFGPEAATPTDYLDAAWDCVASLPPGAQADEAAWRQPAGRIHVAGTESASVWPGYMEGAIEAGERAAREILG